MRAMLSVVAVFACLPAIPAAAQFAQPRPQQYPYESPYQAPRGGQIPPGSYRNSCVNLQLTGAGANARLTATCRGIAGQQRTSTLAYLQCVGDIGNNNGVLICNGAPPARSGGPQAEQQRLPGGTWTQSCIRGQLDGGVLTAQCLDQAGRRVYAEAETRNCQSYSYSNVNGRLVCGGDDYDRPGRGSQGRGGYDDYYSELPAGPWRATCREAAVRDGYVLTARCTNNRGALQSSSIDVRACRRPSVVNENGFLKCE